MSQLPRTKDVQLPDCFIINCADIVLLVSSLMNKSTLTDWFVRILIENNRFSIQVAVMFLRKCFFLELVHDKCLKFAIICTWQLSVVLARQF